MYTAKDVKAATDDWLKFVGKWLGEVRAVIAVTSKMPSTTDAQKEIRADVWVEKIGELADQMEVRLEETSKSEYSGEINAEQNQPVIKTLINVTNEMNVITERMYGVQNHYAKIRLASVERHLLAVFADQESEEAALRKRIAELEIKIKEKKEEKARKEQERIDAENVAIAKKRAKEAVDEFYRGLYAKRALALEKGTRDKKESTEIVSASDNDNTIIEDENRKMRRRSRSVSRMIVKAVKKTVRRSVSAVNHFLEYEENHHQH
ncbi:unnamed protein product [Caenorhabditis sp. 36 PRJEB53466]|nr:unnamed protein product [Caenorhabditis sp. 36 PRJEB53466]